MIVQPINVNNFLRFSTTTEPTPLTSTLASGLHSGNRLWRRSINNPLPALKGETYTFYTNFSTLPFDIADIKVVEDNNCVYTPITDVNEPSVTATAWGTNNVKITLTIPSTATEMKYIRVGVVGSSSSSGWSPTGDFSGITGTIQKVKPISAGRIGVCGSGISVGGSGSYSIVILNYDGTVDATFDTSGKFNGVVNDFVEQSDGKIICVGDFTDYDGVTQNRITRLNTNGTRDASFVIGSGSTATLNAVDVDSTGKVAIAGTSFLYDSEATSSTVARLTSTGSFDISYATSGSSTTLKYQSDDKLLRGSSGSGGIRRYLTDGTLDGTFTTTLSGGSLVNSIDVDGTGKIYLGGNSLLGFLVRLNSDGSTDGTFAPTLNNTVNYVKLDGSEVLIAGLFTTVNGESVPNLAVLDTSGTVDTTKNFGASFSQLSLIKAGSNYIGSSSSSIREYEETIVTEITTVSNPFLVLPLTEQRLNNTHLFKFYHASNIYDYEWSNYNEATDTPYTVRIPSTLKGVEYPREVSTYEAATTGRSRNTRATNRKDSNFQIFFRNDFDHDAVATVINFKYFEINGREYLPLESYEPEYNDELNIYVGNLKLRDVAYSVRINTC